MSSTDDEILEIVTLDDRVVGRATRAEIHAKGLFHRAVHIFVFNRAGDLYVQRRSPEKDRHPSKLDSSAAGHVDPGESYEQAALRELDEELGISETVKEVLSVQARTETDNEHVRLFQVVTTSKPQPNPLEIQWGAFISPVSLARLMDESPEDFVPAFILLWNEFQRKGR
ncbi:MAG: NUDIX domain-containing protein [Thermodesulfobacteriota bacterium]